MPEQAEKVSSAEYSSVKNALRILNCFTSEEPEKRVSDIAAELGIGKSTVSRLLSTLAGEGFVAKDAENQKYRLGLRLLTLSSIVSSQLEVRREAKPILSTLVRETGEAAHIAVFESQEVVYIEQIECSHPVRILSYVGRRNPLHATSSGKILLSFQDPVTIAKVLSEPLASFSRYTITDPDQLKSQLAAIREAEFCLSDSEYLDDVVSMAAPIRDYTKQVVAAISLIGPKHRIQRHLIPSMRNKVVKAAKEISRSLGYMA
ncbi:IclR family transcriptional regulator [Paenibacillus thalictri]|uniref:Glycerol operon regulatory protein n=1 Tax=Paenibacillus thalictri TaxID=2527873 RepID=A0A4Q9DUW7_9BACL|nr:IclR family transcriptional regulator [Paenibacillus thalictri]TBL79368.1 IclR family transcriptional regulator [Paenibacillus thalictri]